MKLTLQIKLLPDDQQTVSLKKTIIEGNAACNEISNRCFEKKIFSQYKIHHEVYYSIKSSFNLSAQSVVRCISKVADSYKINRKVQRNFKPLGAITYDSRILTYKNPSEISIWTVHGRTKLPFICYNSKYIPYIKGESDLVLKKGKFYLLQTVEVPEEPTNAVEHFIGCDFGLNTLIATSDGFSHSAEWVNSYREYRQKVRSSLQAKADTSKRSTKRNARKCLKRLSGKERTTSKIINHTISKSLVASAKVHETGIALEDLKNMRINSSRNSKKFRTKLGKWNFADLRSKITYKSLLNGVPLIVVNPAYTSKTCSVCKSIGNRNNKSFHCDNCGHNEDADFNASKNIATLGAAVNQPEKSTMYCSIALHRSGLKPKYR